MGANVAGGTDCPEALERLEAFLDGELNDEQISEISRHLADCYPCGDRASFERHLREVVRRHCGSDMAPDGLLEKVRARCVEAQGSV